MDSTTLKQLIQNLTQDPELQPKPDGTTYCNCFARKIAQAFQCAEFDNPDLMADDMIRIMDVNLSGKWEPCDGSTASNRALIGGLVFAGKTSAELGEAHGHINVIYPAPRQFSGSLNMDVPMCGNVGKRNGVMKISESFPVSKGEPRYWTFAL